MCIKILKNRPVAFQATYAQKWAIPMCGCTLWIDCPTCDLSIGVTDNMSDAEFVEAVRKEGWLFEPDSLIVCPDCRKKGV